MIRIALDDVPALFIGMLATKAELILDRGVALIVGGIAGVERTANHEGHSPGGRLSDRRLSFTALSKSAAAARRARNRTKGIK